MIINYYDVQIRRIKEEDLELIRYWRNTDKISSKMQYRETISRTTHRDWFNKINNVQKGFAFIIEYKNQPVGMVHSFDDADNLHVESGMFLWEEHYWSSYVPVMVSIMLTDIGFYLAQNKESYIKILKNNINTISYNLQFGYKLCKGENDKVNQQYVLNLNNYEAKSRTIKEKLFNYHNCSSTIQIFLEERDVSEGFIERFQIEKRRDYLKRHGIIIILPDSK
jgi:hypothetical protein